jgi:hypothetical protein
MVDDRYRSSIVFTSILSHAHIESMESDEVAPPQYATCADRWAAAR